MNRQRIIFFTTFMMLLVCCTATFAADFTFTTLAGVAGTVISSADGTGSAAQFSAPRGVAVDSAGNVYVADSSNHTIRKVTAAGVTTTLAGLAGSADTTRASPAKFSEPFGVAVDSAGNVYVADTNNNAIRKITAAGVVTTLAGGSGMGSTDGTGSAAKFSEPHGLVLDSAGNIYVSDYMNHAVRKVTQEGVVTTLAGSLGNSGFTNGQGTAARFSSPQGIAIDSSGDLYLAESHNRTIRKITSSGLVSTFYDGSNGSIGAPRGVAVDSSGIVYVADYGSNVIRKITAAGVLSLLAGTAPIAGSTDGASTAALFNSPSAITVDSANNLYVADTSNNTIRKITFGGTVTTLAGLAGRSSSFNGTGSAARFQDPYAIAVDGSGNAYVADATDHSIRKITADGVVTTLAGNPGTFGSADGTGSAALFKGPLGIAADSSGTVYVADTDNNTIRKITPAGVVTTLAGTAGRDGATDGTGAAARFYSPYGVATDGAGNVFVIESAAVVRKITATGVVTTLAGTANAQGFVDGTGTAARFSVPFDLTVDSSGNLYVSDHGNHAVRKVTPAGVVTTLAGSSSTGYADGTGTAAQFKFPSGIGVDAAGNVFLADTDNQVIRKITPTGVVTTIGGTRSTGSADGVGTAASFYNPKDVAVDSGGNLYVVDRGNHTIRKGSVQTATATNGACGSSSGTSLTGTPTTGLCTSGTASTPTGSGPWYWSCAGTNGGTTASCSAYSSGTPASGAATTKAKIYLGRDDSFTVSNSGAILYGSSGTDSVTITDGASAVTLDQNVERINFSGASGSYAFKQTGNKINVYDTTGTTLLVSVPVQGDTDGTILSFSNGTASAVLTAGVMKLGGATVNPTAATTLVLTTTVGTPATTTTTKAKVYLGTDDSFTVSNSGTAVYGGSGNDTVTIAAGISGVIFDQNIERINFSAASSSYTFKQTGNKINIYDSTGATLLASAPVQGDTDGTVLSFSDKAASAILASGVMTLGGTVITSGTSTSSTTPGAPENFTVTASDSRTVGSLSIASSTKLGV